MPETCTRETEGKELGSESFENTKSKAISGLIWSFLERFGAQCVTFIVSIILARLLDPEVFGEIAIVTVFITILNVFVENGLGNALIQKKDADQLDFCSVFYFNILLCTLLYILLFLASPFIADFFDNPELSPVLRVMGVTIIISSFINIQKVQVARQLKFKKFFFATLGGTVGAAAVGIWMAYSGYGIWALVGEILFSSVANMVILWLTVKWRPSLSLSDVFLYKIQGVIFLRLEAAVFGAYRRAVQQSASAYYWKALHHGESCLL